MIVYLVATLLFCGYSSDSVEVSVQNQFDQEISLFWAGEEGRFHLFDIHSGEIVEMNSYVGHQFMVTLPGSEVIIQDFIIDENDSLIIIGPEDYYENEVHFEDLFDYNNIHRLRVMATY